MSSLTSPNLSFNILVMDVRSATSAVDEPAVKKMKTGKSGQSVGSPSASGAKAKRKPAKKAAPKPTCVDTCRPGRRSGCTIQGKGRPKGNLSCAEVDRRLEALGKSLRLFVGCLLVDE